MAFESYISSSELVIDDLNYSQHIMPPSPDLSRGRIPPPEGFAAPFTSRFPSDLIMSYDEIDEAIEKMERTNTRPSDILKQAGLKCKDQNATNYCWINAPVYCMECLMVIQNQPVIELSPASVGGPIKSYRNRGGWGTEGNEYLVEHGAVPVEDWPANAIDRKYFDDTYDLRRKFRVTEYWELESRNEQQLLSALCHGFPVAIGLNWWSHEVTSHDPLKLGNRKYGTRNRNSWGMGYGENGYFVLQGTKHLPDDAVVPVAIIPYGAAA